jgi:hypothetical protein
MHSAAIALEQVLRAVINSSSVPADDCQIASSVQVALR